VSPACLAVLFDAAVSTVADGSRAAKAYDSANGQTTVTSHIVASHFAEEPALMSVTLLIDYSPILTAVS